MAVKGLGVTGGQDLTNFLQSFLKKKTSGVFTKSLRYVSFSTITKKSESEDIKIQTSLLIFLILLFQTKKESLLVQIHQTYLIMGHRFVYKILEWI